MEEHNTDITTANTDTTGLCTNCHQEPALEGYRTPLCAGCRQQFIRYPIPKWIYAFGAGVLVVMVIALTKVPPYFALATHLGRAQKAIAAHKYKTAQKGLEGILQKYPNLQEPKELMLIAACYNLDGATALQMYNDIKDREVKSDNDTKILAENALSYLGDCFSYDSTIAERVELAATDSVPGLMRLYKVIKDSAAEDKASSELQVASRLYDMNDFQDCKDICYSILGTKPRYYPAISMLAAAYRRLGYYDDAIDICKKGLVINNEDVIMLSQEGKIEMARKNYTQAARYIDQATALDKNNLIVVETQALLAHFTGKTAVANDMLAQLRDKEKDSTKPVYTRTLNVINGKATL